ncbi:MAG: response regulator [Candidatus Riflebacteria bacterium]|nr:response regulator [Candidatus Riflebacteria bacterium]
MPARILVVEDNAASRELMAYLLRSFGHTVLEAVDGQEGVDAARRDRLDLIVMDLHMPRTDGFQAVRELRRDRCLEQTHVVAVTALAMVGDRERVMSAGFDGYIAKPIDPEQFIELIDSFLPPRKRAAPPVPGPPAGESPPLAPIAPLRRGSILVLDDQPRNLEVLSSTLEPHGFTVLAADGVARAMLLCRSCQPVLIISDLHVGDESGIQFLSQIRADPQVAAIPFVMLTSTSRLETDGTLAMSLGATRVLTRPIDPKDLMEAVAAVLADEPER